LRFFLLLFFTILNLFAIIDVAPIDFGDKPDGFSGSAYGSFQKKRGNTDKTEQEYGGRIQYDTANSITWIQGSKESTEVRDTKTDDNSYLQLRYIHQLYSPAFAWEGFAQTKQDKFKSLQERLLYGAGLRFRLYKSEEYGRFFLGLGAFHEEISYTDSNPDEKNNRLSSYISYEKKINKTFEISFISYFQPKLDDESDYISATLAEMTIHLTQVLDLSYILEYDYDSTPPLDVQKSDTKQKLSFIYRFGEGDPLTASAYKFLNSTEQLDDMNTSKIVAVEVEVDEKDIKTASDTFAGKWKGSKEAFSIALDGTGSHTYKNGLYKEKITWTLISTDTQDGSDTAKAQYTKLVIIKYLDEEGRQGRVENYLWSENTLVGLRGHEVSKFKR